MCAGQRHASGWLGLRADVLIDNGKGGALDSKTKYLVFAILVQFLFMSIPNPIRH